MKRRVITIILIAALIISQFALLEVSADSGITPIVTNNINDQNYTYYWSQPVRSHLVDSIGGILTRVEYTGTVVAIEEYDSDLSILSQKTIALELPIYGGFYAGKDYNFLVFGQRNRAESESAEVVRVVRYSKNWERMDSASIYGSNTTVPFDAGSLRMVQYGDMLYVHTSHEMYTASDGLNHQANMIFSVKISEMHITDQYTKVMNVSYGYVSHSFNQFILIDGTNIVTLNHGDAHLRSAVLVKYGKPAGQETFTGKCTYTEAMTFAGAYGQNSTGAELGGFEASDTAYLTAGSSIVQDGSVGVFGQRNIFVAATGKASNGFGTTKVNWLTNYVDGKDDVDVSVPHLVKISDTSFLLLWTENRTMCHTYLDRNGNRTSEIYRTDGQISDCKPIVRGNCITWYCTDNTAPRFYQINLNNPGIVTLNHEHDYELTQTIAPTTSETGQLVYTCSICANTKTVTVPVLNETDYDYQVLSTYCDKNGTGRYTWKDTTYGKLYFDIALPPTGHDYSIYGTSAPTKDKKGSLILECSKCDATPTVVLPAFNEKDYDYQVLATYCEDTGTAKYIWKNMTYGIIEFFVGVPPTGHCYIVQGTTAPTKTQDGAIHLKCDTCQGDGSVILPALNEIDYRFEVLSSFCDEYGVARYTWEDATYGEFSFEADYPPTGHHNVLESVTAPTHIETGAIHLKCSKCKEQSEESLPALNTTDYRYEVLFAHCEKDGRAEYTWKNEKYGVISFEVGIAPIGHNYCVERTDAPTEKAAGVLRLRCANCSGTKMEILPALSENHYDLSITAPTCTEEGKTCYTWKNTEYGVIAFNVATAPLGHKAILGVCERCHSSVPSFQDVPSSSWYYEAVEFAVGKGLMNGTGNGQFSPDVTISRSMLVTLLWRYAGSPVGYTSNFADVPASAWYAQAVAWGAHHNIISGVGQNRFDPDGMLTREQMATLFYRYSALMGLTTTERADLNSYPDNGEINIWSRDAVSWAVATGLIGGTKVNGQTYLQPKGVATRAQLAVIFMRYVQNVVEPQALQAE